MNPSAIPVENIYYLLCYAWDQVEQGRTVDISRLQSTQLVDLFAVVLIQGVERLAKRGLAQTYTTREEEFRGIRGRVDLLQTERRLLRKHGRATCQYDELSVNSLPNRIIKSTLKLLGRHPSIDKTNRAAVLRLARELQGVDDTRITAASFQRVQLNSNSRLYRFLLNICELIDGSWLVDEKTGAYRFIDFFDDDKRMPYVFQFFVYNFLRIERRDLRVSRENIRWRATSDSEVSLSLLPLMQTDVSIDVGARHVILDTKFYRETLGGKFGAQKLHTEHLYQLFSYLANRDPDKGKCEGILLYPTVDIDLQAQFSVLDFPVTVRTLNLARPWQKIHSDLASLVLA